MPRQKGRVAVERGGLSFIIDDVCADDMAEVGSELLERMRLLAQVYPELREDLNPVSGGYPVPVLDEWDEEEGRRRIGFRPVRKAGERVR